MKKITVILIFIICGHVTSIGQTENQFKRGLFLTGGSFSFRNDRTKEIQPAYDSQPEIILTTKSIEFETDMYLGYFPLNKFAIGFKSDLFLSSAITRSDMYPDQILSDIKQNTLLLGPFLRYYIYSGLFVEGYAGFGHINYTFNDALHKQSSSKWTVGLGYDFLLNKFIALEPMINYNTNRILNTSDPKIEQISSDFTITIGFQIFLNVK